MKAMIRTYSGKGANELFEMLAQRQSEVERLLRSVKGFVGYTLARSGDGGFSVTVCDDQAGLEESLQKAKDWIAANAVATGVGAPKVTEGSVIVHLK